MNETEIRNKILSPAIERANETMPSFFLEHPDDSVVFYGRPKAILDSLNLVSFVFILEEIVEEVTGLKIKITTQDVLDTEKAPFASMNNLVAFLQTKMAGA